MASALSERALENLFLFRYDGAMNSEYEAILAKSRAQKKEILHKLAHLSKFNKNGFDRIVRGYHEAVFKNIDCLQCGNCCRLIGPRLRDKDYKVLAKEDCLTPKNYMMDYLKDDGDSGFYLFRELPCPYINEDNRCSVYEKRPLSCEEFPYTDGHNIQKHLVRLGHSAMVCPAAALIAERVIKEY